MERSIYTGRVEGVDEPPKRIHSPFSALALDSRKVLSRGVQTGYRASRRVARTIEVRSQSKAREREREEGARPTASFDSATDKIGLDLLVQVGAAWTSVTFP